MDRFKWYLYGRIQRDGDRGSRLLLTNHKIIGFLSNTGPDPMKIHKATKASIQCLANIKWRFTGGQMMVGL